MQTNEETDLVLYERFLKGDERALEALIDRHRRPMLRFLYGYLQDTDAAEELFSDVFLALYFKRSFIPRENATLRSYLYRIARNKALNALKKRKQRRELSLNALSEKGDVWQEALLRSDADGDPHAVFENTERQQTVARALRSLKTTYREILLLRYYDGLTPKEIAAVTGRTEKQVYNLLQRGKAALKEYFLGGQHENHPTTDARRHRKNQKFKTQA